MRKFALLLVFVTMLSFSAFADNCDCSKCSSDQVCCKFSNGHCSCFPGGITCPSARGSLFNIDNKLVSDEPILLAQKCTAGEPGCPDMKVPPPPVQEPKKSTDTYHPPPTYPKPDAPVYHSKPAPPPDPCPAAGKPTCK
jgi:hypothetical protein